MQEVGAKVPAGARGDAKVTRSQHVDGESRYKAQISAKVFRVYAPGRMVENPATGKMEECQRDEIQNGQYGHTYDQGVIVDDAVVSRRPSRWRLLKEKILLKLKGLLP